jgi:N-formylglutamate amidohydrolase
MNEYISIYTEADQPILASAIHDGHRIRKDLCGKVAIDESIRLREEDPGTRHLASVAENRIIAHHSRFEFDLNRPPERCVYVQPEDAWGLKVWRSLLSEDMIGRSRAIHGEIYKQFHGVFENLVSRFGKLAVYDLHSYNHRRNGPDALPEDPAMNPEINIGTGSMDRNYWKSLVERFISDLRKYNFQGRSLDVRENIKFKGGYFPTWIHQNFNRNICCISIEVKKFYMDEWTGKLHDTVLQSLREAIESTLPGVIEELGRLRPAHRE